MRLRRVFRKISWATRQTHTKDEARRPGSLRRIWGDESSLSLVQDSASPLQLAKSRYKSRPIPPSNFPLVWLFGPCILVATTKQPIHCPKSTYKYPHIFLMNSFRTFMIMPLITHNTHSSIRSTAFWNPFRSQRRKNQARSQYGIEPRDLQWTAG